MNKRFLTGLQPTGRVHLGNYFGAMRPAIELQERGEAYYFIANFHSITAGLSAKELRQNTFDLAADFLACGLDPRKAVFFRQSDVPEVLELYWLLSCVTPMGLLERAHSYKDKTARGMGASHGLFSYPVLMAADILLYDTDVVPVGKDQKQHLEITRDIAIKMNERYGEGTVKVPDALIREETAVVPGLDGEKMSKSYGNTVGMFEEPGPLKKKIMRIPTDSTPVEEPKAVENSLILALHRLVATDDQQAELVADFQRGGTGYGDYKKRLLGAITEYFSPMRERRAQLSADYVEDVLADGAKRARESAREVLDRLRDRVGL